MTIAWHYEFVSDVVPRWPGRPMGALFVRATPRNQGEPGLFVHGLAGSSTNWTDLMAQLVPDISGFAVDLPGFGRSAPPPDGDYSVGAHARAVIELIERLGTGPVHLFGNSLGGAVSVRVAASRPDLVRTLTLISPALPDLLPRVGPTRVLVSAAPRFGPWLLNRLRRVPAETRVSATMGMVYGDPARVHPARLAEAVEDLRMRDDLDHAGPAVSGSARGLVREYFSGALWRDAAEVRCPTLLIHGRRDPLVDPRTAVRASRTFPDLQIVVLREAGHVAMMEYPGTVARYVRERLIGVGGNAEVPPAG